MDKLIILLLVLGVSFMLSVMFGLIIMYDISFKQLIKTGWKKLMSIFIKIKISRIVHKIDVSRHISNHLVGHNHTHVHRKIVGIFIIIIGYTIMKIVLIVDYMFIHILGELIGISIHGIGLIPFTSAVEHKNSPQEEGKPIFKTLKYSLYEHDSNSSRHLDNLSDVQDESNSN